MSKIRIGLEKCSGVYKMTNKITNESYIGSSGNIYNRYYSHWDRMKKGDHDNYKIRNLVELHERSSFIFEVLEYCDKSIIKEREQYYFDLLKPSLNIWPTVFSTIGRSYTPEQLKNFSKPGPIKDKETFKKKLREAWLIRRERPDGIETLKMLNRTGKEFSEETKNLMSLQRKGKPKSMEWKEKIRLSRLGTKRDPINKTWIKGGAI